MSEHNEKPEGIESDYPLSRLLTMIAIGSVLGALAGWFAPGPYGEWQSSSLRAFLKQDWEWPDPKYEIGDTFQSHINLRGAIVIGCGKFTHCNAEPNIIRITAVHGRIARYEILCPHFVPDSNPGNRIQLDDLEDSWTPAPADTEACQ